MICLLKELYKKQAELDSEIAKNHGVSYEQTKDKRLLALLVELGEFANTTRAFKFWSFKPSESKERILDEFSDGLHFLLSLGLAYSYELDSIEVEIDSLDLVDAILNVYHLIDGFYVNRTFPNYVKMFIGYLKILVKLGFTWQDAYDAYFLKLEVNHRRQENQY